MKISFITPTYRSAEWHESVYQRFVDQNWPDKELLVVDDRPEPSSFFSGHRDTRVKYHHVRTRMPIGIKRDFLTGIATGEVVAHLDDDDYYAADYTPWMLSQLEGHDVAKVGGFYIRSLPHAAFAYWDVTAPSAMHFRMAHKEPLRAISLKDYSAEAQQKFHTDHLYGFGFGLMYRRSICQRVHYGLKHWGEDHDFLRSADAEGFLIRIVHDTTGKLCCMRHGDGSALFPQYLLPLFLFEQRFGAAGVAFVDRIRAIEGATGGAG